MRLPAARTIKYNATISLLIIDNIAFSCYNFIHASWDAINKVVQCLLADFAPYITYVILQFAQRRGIPAVKLFLHDSPKVLYWVKVWRISIPVFNIPYLIVLEELLYNFSSMWSC